MLLRCNVFELNLSTLVLRFAHFILILKFKSVGLDEPEPTWIYNLI